ncbi:hypothetical protein CASFOL_026550 [Castilleja foliolosa]|uniref:KIB1-4 beta-propeller domain-containing protein n=1 Tax=Castilleja foliolosa TaxID=1961234 RepID=A0ABD3CI80_9LAMI
MAFSSSSLLRSICVKGISRSSSNLGKSSARSSASWFDLRPLSTAMTASDSVLNQKSPPWLMLPPEFKGSTMSYKFYNLADKKVQTLYNSYETRNFRLKCRGSKDGWLACRGSSHGWLALLSLYDEGFYLYNPISHRHIKLPTIRNCSRFVAKKVILSCSPEDDEENCRVVMIMNTNRNALAFCFPGRSKKWTLMLDENKGRSYYIDCVYSARLKLFFALTNDRKLETWDLGDPSSPKVIKVDDVEMDQYCYLSSLERRVGHLVLAKDEDLLLVMQYTMLNVGPDGSCFHDLDKRCPANSPHMTIGFDIFKYDSEKGKFEYLDSSSLGGLAIFVGKLNHSVAIQASEFPEVKPDSIYFTDAYDGKLLGRGESDDDDDDDEGAYEVIWGGGYDIGIYNYEDKTVSSCYYPCDAPSLKTISPGPIWFFPSRTI